MLQPTDEELKNADCYFPATDGAGEKAQSQFKRAARYGQHLWAQNHRSVKAFGALNGSRNGTKLTKQDADDGKNFLTERIFAVARERVVNRQKFEVLKKDRLYGDLLSSMPMAFNLFGEAALPENGVSRRALAARFGVAATEPSEVVFEWSPERRSSKYTNDRRAFDVALRFGDPAAGPVTIVGIETKYHESATPESIKSKDQREHLAAIAEASGAFRSGWQNVVFGTNTRLMQLMGDHLLALSLSRGAPSMWSSDSRFVLVYPSGNDSYSNAVEEYRAEVLKPGNLSFHAVTLAELLDDAFAHGGQTRDKFAERYLL